MCPHCFPLLTFYASVARLPQWMNRSDTAALRKLHTSFLPHVLPFPGSRPGCPVSVSHPGSLAPLGPWQFLSLSLLSTTLMVLGSSGQVSCRVPLGVCLLFFSWLDGGYGLSGRIRSKAPFLAHHFNELCVFDPFIVILVKFQAGEWVRTLFSMPCLVRTSRGFDYYCSYSDILIVSF